MVVFKNPEQILLIPTMGFVFDEHGICLTLAFLSYAISFTVYEYDDFSPDD